MHRRLFIQLLASTSVTALTFGSRAFAQKGPSGPLASAPTGFVSPATTLPTGKAMPVPQSLINGNIVQSADAGLKLEAINADYNPFRYAADAKLDEKTVKRPAYGAYKSASEAYLGKCYLPIRNIVGGAVSTFNGGNIPAPLQPMLAALSELVMLKTPAHQFLLDNGTLGNRVVFYESAGPGKIGHSHIDRVIEAYNTDHRVRLFKLMSYLHKGGEGTGGQGGLPGDILEGGGQGGCHHVGGFSLGHKTPNGAPVTLKSDWPANYGRLDDDKKDYNAHLIAIDYRGGVRDPIPDEMLAAYNRNADLWDCCAGALVPFTSGDIFGSKGELEDKYKGYEYNPLEIVDQKSAVAVAQSLAKFNEKQFLTEHGAFYCAEGQFVVANLGPQDGTLLKKSKFGNTPFGKIIDNFQKAPGYQGKNAQFIRRNPEIGWEHLKSLGAASGGIDDKPHYQRLKATGRTNTALEWIPETIKGWQAYGPRQKDALIARPMTIATLAWGIFRNYLPIDGIAKTIVTDVMRAFQNGNPAVKAGITALCSGKAPNTADGQKVLGGIAIKAASGFVLALMQRDKVREQTLRQAGYNEITKDADKKKVNDAYNQFLAVMAKADFTNKASVDKALWDADELLSKIEVEREHQNKAILAQNLGNPNAQQAVPKILKKEPLMRYAAPVCVHLWAQHPFLAETECFRYVATAMHTAQAKVKPTLA